MSCYAAGGITKYSKHWFYIHKTAIFQIPPYGEIQKNSKKKLGEYPQTPKSRERT